MFTAFAESIGSKDFKTNPHTRLFIQVAIGTIPILIFGYLLRHIIDNQFRSMYVIAVTMVVFSVVIAIAEKISRKNVAIENINVKDSIFIVFNELQQTAFFVHRAVRRPYVKSNFVNSKVRNLLIRGLKISNLRLHGR